MVPLPAALRPTRDQVIVLAALIVVTVLAWVWLARTGQDMATTNMAMPGMDTSGMDMSKMDMQGMAMSTAVTAWDVVLASLMWAVMMAGMMLPGAMPMILLFAMVQRRRRDVSPFPATGAFLAGYAVVWGGFAVAAAALQLTLARTAALSPELMLTSRWAAGAVLLGAGIYELSPLKYRCLRHCRGPLDFVVRHWRPGLGGALRMGLLHGGFCLGCCWALMLLLFVGGVMNLLLVAALGVLVLAQKLLPGGWAVTAATAGLLFAAGAGVLAGFA